MREREGGKDGPDKKIKLLDKVQDHFLQRREREWAFESNRQRERLRVIDRETDRECERESVCKTKRQRQR